jgi:hypothetical protein
LASDTIGATTTWRGASQKGSARVVLDQEADEALEGAEDGAVEHDGAVLGAVLADIGRVEPLGQHVVELEGAGLPGAADRVGEVEFELRAVEGALALGIVEGEAGLGQRLGEGGLGAVPGGVGARARCSGRVASL